MRKIPNWLYGCTIVPAAFFLLVALGTIFLSIYSKIPQTLSEDKRKEYVYSIAGYVLPDTVDLIYSKRYWPEGSEPMSVCSVYRLKDSGFTETINSNFRVRDRGEYDDEAILPDKGCNNFKDEGEVSDEISTIYMKEGDHLRGYAIQVNDLENLVMFEMYLYD